jgi:hypothetical protein
MASSIVDTVRQMWHYGQRVAISTQFPTTLPPEVLELSSVVVCHKFHSKDWFECLCKKVPLSDDGFSTTFQNLETGEALVFSASNGKAPVLARDDEGEGGAPPPPAPTTMLQMRAHLTADGGASRTHTARK